MHTYACLVFALAISHSHGVMNIDTVNKKIPNAVCFRDVAAQTMELNFFVSFNGNQVDRVMALSDDTFVRNTDGSTNEATCTMTDFSNGNVQFTSRVSLSGNNDFNRCGARRIANTNNFLWVAEVRAMYGSQTYVDIDRRYFITCIYDSALSSYAVAQLQVFGTDASGISEKLSPVNTMSVLTQQTTGGAYTSTDTVNLDQMVKLQVSSRVASVESALDPYGVYPFTCDFGPFDPTQRTIFILSNGCPATSNSFGLTQGFQFSGFDPSSVANKRLFRTQTDSFVMATAYPANNFYYLSCYVGYCYGTAGTDTKCTNYCASNSGRKRRQEELTEYESITIAIRLNGALNDTTDTQGGQQETPTEESSKLGIIVGTAVASVAFLLILLVVVVMLCCRPGCCYGDKDRLWEESSSGSTVTSGKSSRPTAVVPAYIVSPKV